MPPRPPTRRVDGSGGATALPRVQFPVQQLLTFPQYAVSPVVILSNLLLALV
jgi:hypothetical protein